ncbi:hypothetical protein KM295_03795 [Natronomonas sp. F2-12]|jgi:hypothetical protein|uniref:Uncharacterized protein n=1 Tax=Natronomonas aquatica TaxID=2841590 RepID=A0A9R1CRN6_9EURY|nr:hypothetical protein [Natronomonas aquatica]MCQ4332625.1 hypothetical protein [Natronomonas aquatica]
MNDGDRDTPGDRENDGEPRPERDTGGSGASHPETADRDFDWRGWTLVAAIFVAFLLVPGIIYVYPHAPSAVGLSFWDTYLVLPMIPAILLGALAVWATTRP